MSNRGRRGGAAALFAARMTDEIETDQELPGVREQPDGVVEIEEPGDEFAHFDDVPEPGIDYIHVDDEPADEEPEPAAAPDAVADLARQLAELKAEREAEKARAIANDEAAELRQQSRAVSQAMGAAKRALDAAKAELAKAGTTGDWTAVAEAQAQIATATGDLREFEGAADEISAAIEAFNKGARRAPAPAPAAQADPFEAAIAVMSDKSKEWCRRNKADLTKSPARGMKAQAFHLEAVDAGLKPDTPEYFNYLDKQMGYAVTKTTKAPRPTGRPQTAAPAGRPSSASGKNEVKLSRDEVAMAAQMGMTAKAYAARKLEIIENGRNPQRGGPTYSNVSPAARR